MHAARVGDIAYFTVSNPMGSDAGSKEKRAASSDSRHLWSDAIVLYTISSACTGKSFVSIPCVWHSVYCMLELLKYMLYMHL